MRYKVFTSLFLLLLLEVSAYSCLGQEIDASQLDEINQKVERSSIELKHIIEQQKILDTELSQLEYLIQNLKKDKAVSETKLAETVQHKLKLIESIQESQSKIENMKSLSIKRLRAFYMLQRYNSLEYFWQVSRVIPPDKAAVYLGKISFFERRMLQKLASLKEEYEGQVEELSQVIENQQKIQGIIQAQSAKLKEKVTKQRLLVEQVKIRKRLVEETLTTLRAQALRLETVLVSLTSGKRMVGKEQTSEDVLNNHNKTANLASFSKEFKGIGLQAFGSRLKMPVEGKIIKRFGNQKHGEFEDFIFNKGLEFNVVPESFIKAIALAKVVYHGYMPGYGNLLILDHGKRSYSLYGRFDLALVGLNEVVEQGQIIAKTGNPDAKGRSFYFELRENGQAINPKKYFPGAG